MHYFLVNLPALAPEVSGFIAWLAENDKCPRWYQKISTMNRIFVTIIFVIFNLTVAAQKQVYKLHPILGDTLENNEIVKYYLFQDYTGDSIDYLILYNDNEKFYLEGISYRAGKFNIQIKEDEVLSQKEQVEKLKIYYHSVLKEDSAELIKLGTMIPLSDSLTINMRFMSPEFLKSVKKDIRRKYWEELRKETKRNQENGMLF